MSPKIVRKLLKFNSQKIIFILLFSFPCVGKSTKVMIQINNAMMHAHTIILVGTY